MRRDFGLVGWAVVGFLAVGLAGAAGCNALLDISEIEFADPTGGSMPGGGGYGAQPTGGQTTGGNATGGNGTGATGLGGSGGGAGEGGSPCIEICDDGTDNDGNALADCADPCCQGIGYRCVPTEGFTSPWSGPYVAYVGAGPAPGCPSSWSDPTLQGVVGDVSVAGPHTCSSCSCGGPAGISCSAGTIQLWESPGCTGVSPGAQSQGAGCTAITQSTLPLVSARANGPTPTGGSCTPSGGTPSLPDWSGATEVTVCGSPVGGAGCDANEVCAHVPPGQSACIMRGGNRTCGEFTTYTELQTVEEVVDSRTCFECSCGSPSGASCSATTTIFSDSGCTGSTATVPNDASCVTVSSPTALTVSVGAPTGGSCTPDGGDPIGDISTSTMTLCCLP